MAEGLPSEAELRAALDKFGVGDVLVQALATAVSIGFHRVSEEARDLPQARLAIESLRALEPVLREGGVDEALVRDLEQARTNLQLAYAKAVSDEAQTEDRVRLKPDPSRASPLAAAQEARADAYFRTGDYERVARILDEAAGAASGDRRLEAAIAAERGMLLHYRAIELTPEERADVDPGREQELFEEALAIRRDVGDTEGVAESLFQLGLVHQVLRRDGETAAPLFREALSLIETVANADPLLRSEVHRHVGFDLLLREERHEEALEHLRASLGLRRGLSEHAWTVSGLVALAMAERLAGRLDDATAHASEALELARAEGLKERVSAAAESELTAIETARSGRDVFDAETEDPAEA